MSSVNTTPFVNFKSFFPQYSTNTQSAVQTPPQNNTSSLLQTFFPGREIKGLYLNKINLVPQKPIGPYKNNLRSLFQNNNAIIMAVIPRTWNAKDKDGNGFITENEEHGTFRNAVPKLDEAKALGINTLHVLPINTPGKKNAMGTAGSIYAPDNLLEIDPTLSEKNTPEAAKEDLKYFVDEAHKRGIAVMVDLPSCGSVDMYEKHPELMAKDGEGLPKIPQGWNDIRMFEPFTDEKTRKLNEPLLQLHKDFVDMCIDAGVDGIRADVARAKPVEFWDRIITYARSKDPEFAFLAECYTYEDASPMLNMPADRPADALKAGFDSYYSQYHIFHGFEKASDFNDLVVQDMQVSIHWGGV